MAISEQERIQIVEEVINKIKDESQGVDELPKVTTLDGINSLPAMKGTQVVVAPISLLGAEAANAAAEARTATQAANTATINAQDAERNCQQAKTNAQNAAARANEAASKAENLTSVNLSFNTVADGSLFVTIHNGEGTSLGTLPIPTADNHEAGVMSPEMAEDLSDTKTKAAQALQRVENIGKDYGHPEGLATLNEYGRLIQTEGLITEEKWAAEIYDQPDGGVAPLDEFGHVPVDRLPIDDIATELELPETKEVLDEVVEIVRRLDESDGQYTNLQGDLIAINDRADALEVNITANEERINANAERLDTVSQNCFDRTARIENTLAAHADNIERLELGVTAVGHEIVEAGNSIRSDLGQEISTLQSDLARTNENLCNAERNLCTVAEKAWENSSHITGIWDELAEVKSFMAEVASGQIPGLLKRLGYEDDDIAEFVEANMVYDMGFTSDSLAKDVYKWEHPDDFPKPLEMRIMPKWTAEMEAGETQWETPLDLQKYVMNISCSPVFLPALETRHDAWKIGTDTLCCGGIKADETTFPQFTRLRHLGDTDTRIGPGYRPEFYKIRSIGKLTFKGAWSGESMFEDAPLSDARKLNLDGCVNTSRMFYSDSGDLTIGEWDLSHITPINGTFQNRHLKDSTINIGTLSGHYFREIFHRCHLERCYIKFRVDEENYSSQLGDMFYSTLFDNACLEIKDLPSLPFDYRWGSDTAVTMHSRLIIKAKDLSRTTAIHGYGTDIFNTVILEFGFNPNETCSINYVHYGTNGGNYRIPLLPNAPEDLSFDSVELRAFMDINAFHSEIDSWNDRKASGLSVGLVYMGDLANILPDELLAKYIEKGYTII